MGRDSSRCISCDSYAVLLTGQSGGFSVVLVRSDDFEHTAFSSSYEVARQRFLEAARDVRAQTASYPINQVGPSGESLSIDVAWVGAREPTQAVVVTSGLHGVEGFFGSAVQLSWLSRLARGEVDLPPRTTVVLVHAVNPFGCAWRRRADSRNVDLNRNFVDRLAGERYFGTPDGYGHVQKVLAPSTVPSWLSYPTFRVCAAWLVARHGEAVLRTAEASGQYEDQNGLFFGGYVRSESTALIQSHFWSWTDGSKAVVHLDLHTGLGPFADYQLFVEQPHACHLQWYWTHFDYERVVSVAERGQYYAEGVMGAWLARHSPVDYRFACLELGTHQMIRVLAALREENRVHHYGSPETPVHSRVKKELLECFCPRSHLWRRKATRCALDVIRQAVTASVRLTRDKPTLA